MLCIWEKGPDLGVYEALRAICWEQMLQVFSFISLAPAMEQGIVTAFKQMFFFNIADKKVHWLNILFLIHG
jgi:hypothetical protein